MSRELTGNTILITGGGSASPTSPGRSAAIRPEGAWFIAEFNEMLLAGTDPVAADHSRAGRRLGSAPGR
jgi:hypothetical protein